MTHQVSQAPILDTLMGSALKTWEGLLGSARPLHVIELQQLPSVLLKWGSPATYKCASLAYHWRHLLYAATSS